MTVYRVGDRVKKVRGQRNIGCTGEVVGFHITELQAAEGFDIVVRYDGWWMNTAGVWRYRDNECEAACKSKFFEPIQPLPTAKELMERENAPDFSITRPTPVYAHLRVQP